MRIFMVANCVVLGGLAAWLLSPAVTGNGRPEANAADVFASPSAAPLPVITKEELLAKPGKWFGLSLPKAPHSEDELNRVAQAAGARPNMLQYFVRWDQEFKSELVDATYRQGQLPVISWEPWEGKTQGGNNQPKYALAKIINGEFDRYLTRFATGVRNKRVPIGIRFAHEMNGRWYPWNEEQSGNQKGQYVQAWRHIYNVFKKVGANNVIWIWSPNILRPVPNVSLSQLYPGDEYVDWIGMVGYGVNESTASATFDPTLKAMRKFTKKPLVITETAAQPGSLQLTWIKDFFKWLAKQPDVVGFIWFEYSKEQGGSADWRFSHRSDLATAFKAGLAGVRLVPAPVSTPALSPTPTPNAG
jgi:hypothetical protein